MTEFTLILSLFKSLALDHLEKCLYSLSKQTTLPDKLLLFDNNTDYTQSEIQTEIARHFPLSSWQRVFVKHGDPKKTLSWANNHAIALCDTDNFIFCRADFIYDYSFCEHLMRIASSNTSLTYISSWFMQMNYREGVARDEYGTVDLESFNWRASPKSLFQNIEGSRIEKNVHIDGPSFLTSKQAIAAGSGFDEGLSSWGYNQQSAQINMARAGVKMIVVPEVLAFHMDHAADGRDKDRAIKEWQTSPRRSPEEAQWMEQNLKVSME